MATGDKQDIIARLKSVLPAGWFASNAPILDGILGGIAGLGEFAYALIQYARLQTRIKTAVDGWLDIVAYDYFGPAVARQQGETDTAFRSRILANLLPLRATRQAMVNTLTALLGITPLIKELWRPGDTGAWNQLGGWNVYGAYSDTTPYQAFIDITRRYTGLPWVSGYGVGLGGYNRPSGLQWGSLTQAPGYVTNQAVLDAINVTKVEGTVVWARFLETLAPPGPPPPIPPPPNPAYRAPYAITTLGVTYALGGWNVPSAGAWSE